MRTIRLIDPRPGRPAPPFGSSEWASESCLAEWSQFEREWLGPDPRQRAGRHGVSAVMAVAVGVAAGAALVALVSVALG